MFELLHLIVCAICSSAMRGSSRSRSSGATSGSSSSQARSAASAAATPAAAATPSATPSLAGNLPATPLTTGVPNLGNLTNLQQILSGIQVPSALGLNPAASQGQAEKPSGKWYSSNH